jgi:hypothetical protein
MPPKRPRTLAREAARDAQKLTEAKAKLAAIEAGGCPERPIEVASASLVEPRALHFACLACDGALELVDHRVRHEGSALLRELVVQCKRCSRRRTVWVRVVQVKLH